MIPCIISVKDGIRISSLVRQTVTVRCRGCGSVFTATTNDKGGVTHICPGKPKGYYCGFQVDDGDLVAAESAVAL